MPSSQPHRGAVSRRRLLAGLGTGVSGMLAGCTGGLPGTGPRQIDATQTVTEREIVWRYPPTEGDTDGIGYAAIGIDRVSQRGAVDPILHMRFNSTVGGVAAGESYQEFEADWFRFRIGPPATYPSDQALDMRVQPPTWPRIELSYDHMSGSRHLVVESEHIGSAGTIEVPIVVAGGGEALPERLTVRSTVQASEPGVLDQPVRMTARGSLPLGPLDSPGE